MIPSSADHSRLWRGLPGLIVLLGLLLSAVVYYVSMDRLRERQRIYFDFRAREAIELIDTRVKTYQQVLRGAQGLFDAGGSVDRERFRLYVERQQLTEHYPGIQGVGYAEAVRPAGRAAHTARIRAGGYPTYQIRPHGEQPLYGPIIYLEPFWGRNLRAFGYDMYSEPVRRAAMAKAAATGTMALSGKVLLVQDAGLGERAGFLMYQAIYEHGRSLDTPEQRHAALQGWVYAPFRMSDFLHSLMGERAADLMITLYDGEETTAQALMHDERDATGALATFETTHQLHMMDHVWTVQLRSTPSMLLRVDERAPTLLAMSTLVLSLLLGALVWALVTGRERALQTARRMNEALILERARLRAILEGTRVGTWEWNVQTGETRYNTHWAHMVGYELEELAPLSIRTWMDLSHPDDLKLSERLLQQHFRGERDFYECEARMKHKDGRWIWVLDRGKVTSYTPEGKPLMMYGTHQDITERKEREQAYQHGAQHDPLTGLPNRALLADRLERALAAAAREGSCVGLMYIDLDGFKGINDQHGHDAGDVVLRTMARRIQRVIRAADTLARVGGDEFVALLPDIGNADHARTLAQKIATEARRAITLDESTQVELSVSIGIALYPAHGDNAATLTVHADRAMYRAKRNGKNAIVVYEPGRAPSDTAPDTAAGTLNR